MRLISPIENTLIFDSVPALQLLLRGSILKSKFVYFFILYLRALINAEVSGMEVRIASLQDSLPHNMRVNPQSPTAEESSWRRRRQACWPRWQTRQGWWRSCGQAGGWKQLRCRIRCRIMWELPRPRDGLPPLLPQTIPQSTPISRQIH